MTHVHLCRLSCLHRETVTWDARVSPATLAAVFLAAFTTCRFPSECASAVDGRATAAAISRKAKLQRVSGARRVIVFGRDTERAPARPTPSLVLILFSSSYLNWKFARMYSPSASRTTSC